MQSLVFSRGLTDSSVGKESACNAGNPSSIPGIGNICWRRDRLPIPVFLGFPGGSDGKESACNAGDLSLIPGLEYLASPCWCLVIFCSSYFM